MGKAPLDPRLERLGNIFAAWLVERVGASVPGPAATPPALALSRPQPQLPTPQSFLSTTPLPTGTPTVNCDPPAHFHVLPTTLPKDAAIRKRRSLPRRVKVHSRKPGRMEELTDEAIIAQCTRRLKSRHREVDTALMEQLIRNFRASLVPRRYREPALETLQAALMRIQGGKWLRIYSLIDGQCKPYNASQKRGNLRRNCIAYLKGLGNVSKGTEVNVWLKGLSDDERFRLVQLISGALERRQARTRGHKNNIK